jgi:benzodiazapine receptor
MKNTLRIILSFVIVFGTVALSLFFFTPQALYWYNAISKPDFTPPLWVFAPIWILLYAFMALAFARIWGHEGGAASRRWFFIFIIQLLLNILWSALFFTFHSLLLGVVDIIVLWFFVVILTASTWEIDRISFWLLIPYLAWMTFAMILTIGIWWID